MSQGERLATNGLDGAGGENGELLSLKDHAEYQEDEKPASPQRRASGSLRGDNCCEKILRCLSYVPCGSLISWILLLLGLGAFTGSILIGTRKSRVLLDNEDFLWFMELAVPGVVVSMFVLGTCFLVAGHLSSDPTSRRIFNSSAKNRCARGFNIFLLGFVYVLCVVWVLTSTMLATPIVLLVLIMFIVPQDKLDLSYYGFSDQTDFNVQEHFEELQDVLICYGVTLLSSILIVISLVHFLICISANITHLKDNRFATLNAYETEELRNSKHSVLDTNM